MERGSATSLAPGFRFHPTDEELVRYYLKRKVCGKPFRFDAICEIDVYKSEPWDLPDKSRLKSRDLEWYFFSVLDKKYGNGSRTNRATEKGYWKTTGKDRTVYHNSQVVGMKKTLVYHSGRAPRGERTNWVMHEYRLVDKQLEKAGIVQDAFVLCRIFQKSGSGPKNGERYGAPFIEEEWDDDEMVFIPGENAEEKLIVGDDEFVETCDLGQNLNTGLPSEDAPPPLYFYYEDGNKHAEDAIDDEHKPLIDTNENFSGSEIQGDPNYFEVPAEYEMQAKCGKNEFIIEQSNTANPLCPDSFLQEPYFDAIETPPSNDGFFLETNDLSDPIDPEPPTFDMLDEYLRYFDVADDNTEFFDFDSWKNGTEGSAPADPVSLFIKDEVGVSEKISRTSEEIMELHDVDGPSSSYQNPEVTEYASDVKYPFSKKAHCTLETFLAPPLAFASELPTKDAAALRFALSTQSSSSVHVTAGVIHIRNTGLKNGSIDVVLSFAHGVDSLGTSLASLVWSKSMSAMSGEEWLYFFFFTWILVIVCVSFKVGACVYSR